MGNDEISSLGASIGSRLAAAKTSTAQPAIAIKLFVDAVMARHPTVKLPELFDDAEVKRWLDERGLGKGHLRQTLTETRRVLCGKRGDKVVKRPRSVKPKPTDTASRATWPAAELSAGAVLNRPLTGL